MTLKAHIKEPIHKALKAKYKELKKVSKALADRNLILKKDIKNWEQESDFRKQELLQLIKDSDNIITLYRILCLVLSILLVVFIFI